MPPFIAKVSKAVTRYILGFTLYETMRSSPDFEDVKLALKDQTDWSIELFRSYLAIHLIIIGSDFVTLCTLSLLVMAETIRFQYGRLTPAELKERAECIGYATFAILFALLDIGFIVVRIASLVALSGTSGLATGLVLVTLLPFIVPPLLTYVTKIVKRKERASGGEVEAQSGIALDDSQH